MSAKSICCKCGKSGNLFFESERGNTLHPTSFYCRVCKQKETKFRKAHAKELPTVISHSLEEENVNGYKMMFDVTYKDEIIDEKDEEKCLDMKKTAVHLTREQQRDINGMFLNIYLRASQLESGAISKEEWMNELMTRETPS